MVGGRIRKGKRKRIWSKAGGSEPGKGYEGRRRLWAAGAGGRSKGERARMKRRLGGQEDKGRGRRGVRCGWRQPGLRAAESPSEDGVSAARIPGDAGHRRPEWVGDGDIRGETHQTEVVPYPSPKFCQRQQQQEDRSKYLNSTASPEPRHPGFPGSAQEHCAGSVCHHLFLGSRDPGPQG